MINSFQVFYRKLVPSRNIVAVFLLFTITATQTFLTAQQVNSDIKGSTSLMLQFFGPEALGINLNHNASQRVSLNAGLGADLGIHIGANAYLTDRSLKHFAWYGGVQLYLIREFQFSTGNIFGSWGSSSTTNKRESQAGIYFPIGFEYIAKKGFTVQMDVGPNLVGKDWAQTNTAPIMGSLKIGYTFKPRR